MQRQVRAREWMQRQVRAREWMQRRARLACAGWHRGTVGGGFLPRQKCFDTALQTKEAMVDVDCSARQGSNKLGGEPVGGPNRNLNLNLNLDKLGGEPVGGQGDSGWSEGPGAQTR